MSSRLRFRRVVGFLVLTTGTALLLWPQDAAPGTAMPKPPAGNNPPSLEELLPGIKDQAIVLNILALVMEKGTEEIWESANSKVTISGRPVALKLVGANIVIAAQFTPYLQRDGSGILVAQGQIWIDVPHEGIRYQTTMQTIPIKFGEQIYFFPLGQEASSETRLEIRLEVRPYVSAPSMEHPEGEHSQDDPSTPPTPAESSKSSQSSQGASDAAPPAEDTPAVE